MNDINQIAWWIQTVISMAYSVCLFSLAVLWSRIFQDRFIGLSVRIENIRNAYPLPAKKPPGPLDIGRRYTSKPHFAQFSMSMYFAGLLTFFFLLCDYDFAIPTQASQSQAAGSTPNPLAALLLGSLLVSTVLGGPLVCFCTYSAAASSYGKKHFGLLQQHIRSARSASLKPLDPLRIDGRELGALEYVEAQAARHFISWFVSSAVPMLAAMSIWLVTFVLVGRRP